MEALGGDLSQSTVSIEPMFRRQSMSVIERGNIGRAAGGEAGSREREEVPLTEVEQS